MPNRHGDLNIEEAAAYLGVSPSLMWSLYSAPGGPLYLLGVTEQEQEEGPWFTNADLDSFRPRMAGVIAREVRLLEADPGEPKSAGLRAGSGPA